MARKFVGASHHSETRARPMDIRNTRNRPGSVGIPADLLPFPQWQAKQLVSRDAMFGFFLLLVYVVYLQKTTPDFCASTTALHGEGQRTPLQTKQQQWPVLWSLVCDDAATAAGTLAPSVKFSWLLQSAVRVLQVHLAAPGYANQRLNALFRKNRLGL